MIASSFAVRGVVLARLGEVFVAFYFKTLFPFQTSSPNPLVTTKIEGVAHP